MTTKFECSEGKFTLHRYPKSSHQNLRAWDAADEFVLERFVNENQKTCLKSLVIFNDAFGALSVALNKFQPTVITDSIISQKAIGSNLRDNQLSIDSVNILNSLEVPSQPVSCLIIKIPKSLDYLKYFLNSIRPNLSDNSVIVLAGMVKNMPATIWKLLENTLGPTQTSLAKKKAKLIEVKIEKDNTDLNYPKYFTQENTENKIYNHANVFSKTSLDIGTRFLLSELPKYENINNIIDLGCGNGIVGLNLAQQYPNANVTFTDESYMAVESARLTANNNLQSIEQHQFIVNNCLDGFEKNKFDLIVCNPPFHQSHSIGLHIALQMFKQSHQCLHKGGKFIVIANRHLPYFPHLKRLFGKVTTIASNSKFNLYEMKRI
jgi:16S rRNA (guanine1207-N2)-methyltransferase